MNRKTVALVFIAFILGMGFGFVISYMIYEQQIPGISGSKSWHSVLNVTIAEEEATPLFIIPGEEWRIHWEVEPEIKIVLLQGEISPIPRNQTMFTIEGEEWSGIVVYDKNGTSVSTISIPLLGMAVSNWEQKNGEIKWSAYYGWTFDIDPEVYGVNYVIPGNGYFYVETFGIYNSVTLTIEAYY